MATKKTSGTPLLRAKFYCTSLDKNDDDSDNRYEHLHLAPVVGDGSDENESFSKFTPSGSLEMRVTNPDLFGKVQPGDTFYLDFIPVEKED